MLVVDIVAVVIWSLFVVVTVDLGIKLFVALVVGIELVVPAVVLVVMLAVGDVVEALFVVVRGFMVVAFVVI